MNSSNRSDIPLNENCGATTSAADKYRHESNPSLEESSNNDAPTAQPSLPLPDRSPLDHESEDNGNEDENVVNDTNDKEGTSTEKENSDTTSSDAAESHNLTKTTGVTPFAFVPDSSPLLESFVQQANRVQSLVLSAMQQQSLALRRAERSRANDAGQEPPTQRRRVNASDGLLEGMLREKTMEVSTLQRQTESMETELSMLQATNQSLRNEVEASQKRADRNAESLRRVNQHADRARADADSAEQTAASLSQTLQSLQAVVRETHEEMEHLQNAHKEIQQKSATLQADLWQKEVRIACIEKEYNSLLVGYQKLERAQTSWKQEKSQLEQSVEEKDRKVGAFERRLQERRTMDEAREQRVKRLEEEWREAQSLAVEATSAQSASEETQAQLRSDLRTLQKKNEELHQRLVDSQEKAHKDHELHTKVLQQAEREGNQWHIQLETCQDENQRLRVEKSNLEKQLSKLKMQMATKSASEIVSPDGDKTSVPHEFASLVTNAKTPEIARNLENSGATARRVSTVPSGCCVICGKLVSGLKKKCQCGGGCDCIAHYSCIKISGGNQESMGQSVGIPGTPNFSTPIVLCGAAVTATTPQAS